MKVINKVKTLEDLKIGMLITFRNGHKSVVNEYEDEDGDFRLGIEFIHTFSDFDIDAPKDKKYKKFVMFIEDDFNDSFDNINPYTPNPRQTFWADIILIEAYDYASESELWETVCLWERNIKEDTNNKNCFISIEDIFKDMGANNNINPVNLVFTHNDIPILRGSDILND